MNINILSAFVVSLLFQAYCIDLTDAECICPAVNCPSVANCPNGAYTTVPPANHCPGCPICRPNGCPLLPCAFVNCACKVTPVNTMGCPLCAECYPTPTP